MPLLNIRPTKEINEWCIEVFHIKLNFHPFEKTCAVSFHNFSWVRCYKKWIGVSLYGQEMYFIKFKMVW